MKNVYLISKIPFHSAKAFSLIELMVVISIIAILSVIGAVIYSGVQSRARDSVRQTEVKDIAAALESKKNPPSPLYASVTTADFHGGIPTDGTAPREFCFTESATKTPTAAPVAVWTPTAGTPCPSGYATFSGAVNATTQSWRICALLENGATAATQIFCKVSAQ